MLVSGGLGLDASSARLTVYRGHHSLSAGSERARLYRRVSGMDIASGYVAVGFSGEESSGGLGSAPDYGSDHVAAIRLLLPARGIYHGTETGLGFGNGAAETCQGRNYRYRRGVCGPALSVVGFSSHEVNDLGLDC